MRALLLACLALLAACGQTEGRAPCPAGAHCLEVGNQNDPLTLDPNKVNLTVESNVVTDLMIGLTTLDAAGKAIPGMATRWETAPDGLTWTFRLRDAVWSDGVPVTAQDFVFSLHRLEDPKTASSYSYLLYPVVGAAAVNAGKAAPETMGVEAIGSHTLRIRLSHPAPDLPQILTHASSSPIPEHVVRRWGEAWVQPEHYVSNGPYTLQSWILGDRIVLRRNPRFWDAAQVHYDEVRYYPTTDAVSAEREVANGQLDMITNFNSNRAPYLQKRLPGFVRATPLFATYYMALNSHVPALADKRVRLALMLGIDRDFLAAKLLRAGQTPAYAFVPPGMTSYPGLTMPVWTAWPFARRQAVARQLLAAAGHGPSHPLSIELKYGNSGDRVLAPAIQADLRSIGVALSLAPEESQVAYADFRSRNFEIGFASWYADFDDPSSFLALFSSDAGSQNYGDYRNPRYDALLARADNEPDARRRGHILAEAEAMAMSDVAIVPIYYAASRNLLTPAVSGYVGNPLDIHPKRFFRPATP